MQKEDFILSIQDLSKNFGGVEALRSVSFDVERGEIVGLLGPNGSGKTTMFNVITGVFGPSKGAIRFKGEPINKLSRHKIALKGVSRTFQATRLFSNLSVAQNVTFGAICRRENQKACQNRVADLLQLLNLRDYANVVASSITHVQQRRLMIAVALATNPELLLLDEVVAGMSGDEVNDTTDTIREIRDRGITILLIEHNMKVAMGISDRIVVLSEGRKIAEGVPKEIVQSREVIEAYLGGADFHAKTG